MRLLHLIFLLGAATACCQAEQAPKEPEQTEQGVVYATKYKVVGSPYRHDVEKFVVDGHEYLVFSAKVANPPTVVHSEACPCKQ